MRSVPEWIGKTDDEKVPERVQLRIWRRDGGRCHITHKPIMPGDDRQLDHVKALIDGGEHRESNLAFTLTSAHREKTAVEVARRAVNDARAKSHAGIGGKQTALAGRTPGERRAARDARTALAGKLPRLGPRPMFVDGDRENG